VSTEKRRLLNSLINAVMVFQPDDFNLSGDDLREWLNAIRAAVDMALSAKDAVMLSIHAHAKRSSEVRKQLFAGDLPKL
jgi:hypothetical protein